MTTSVLAGLNAKLEGHQLEIKLAQKLGSSFIAYDDGKNKTDLMSKDHKIKISLKNSQNQHTQVALISQKTLSEFLNLDDDGDNFMKLFFGFSDGTELNQKKVQPFDVDFSKLSYKDEISRNRLLCTSIPKKLSHKFMLAINDRNKNNNFYEKIVGGSANVIGWTRIKNDVNSVEFALMSDLIELLKKGTWKFSSSLSTIELIYDNKRLMYLQMKGSSKKFSSGYHSCMFHLYRGVMNEIYSTTNLNTLKF